MSSRVLKDGEANPNARDAKRNSRVVALIGEVYGWKRGLFCGRLATPPIADADAGLLLCRWDVSKEGGGIPPKDALGRKWGSGMAIWMLGTSVSPGENLGSGPMKALLSLGLGKEEFVDIEDVREGESWGVTVRWS